MFTLYLFDRNGNIGINETSKSSISKFVNDAISHSKSPIPSPAAKQTGVTLPNLINFIRLKCIELKCIELN